MNSILAWIQEQMAAARNEHGVNPVVFLGLMVACAPFFYYSIYRLARATVQRDTKRISLWASVFLAATALPYLYVLFFGRNLPWWIYLVLAVLIGQGVYQLVKKLRRRP
jgi:ABC-type Co2+ transport system permease subunit